MINPRDGNREDSRRQIKRIAFVQSSQFESDYASILTSTLISLDVEVDGVGLHVYLANQFFGNWNRKKQLRNALKQLKSLMAKNTMQA